MQSRLRRTAVWLSLGLLTLGAAGLAAAILQHPAFIVISLFAWMALNFLAVMTRCRTCGGLLYRRRGRWLGLPVYYATFLPNRRCPRCGSRTP